MENLLRRLCDNGVEFVIVGGFAAVSHGVTRVTRDIDLCIPFTRENLVRVRSALEGIHPRHRMIPGRIPLTGDPTELEQFKNLYLETDLGALDLLSEIAGIGDFLRVLERGTVTLPLWGMPCKVLGLEGLIEAKQAMSAPKDRQDLLELKAIRQRLHEIDVKEPS
jgi:hypothetical protein